MDNEKRDEVVEEVELDGSAQASGTEEDAGPTVEEVTEETSDEVSEAAEKYEQLNDQFIRLQADYANYKRRSEQDKLTYIDLGLEKLAQAILPVIDNFERALEMSDQKETSFYEGVSLIERQLIEVLNNFDIQEIQAINEPFDPNYHHAVLTETVPDVESGVVIEVLQKGYVHNDKVIRPAMVKVSE